MTIADMSLGAFAFFSVLRLIAYMPQIVKIAQDKTGAKAISNMTWMLFAISHLATALYAMAALQNLVIGAVFIANTMCCLVIVGFVVRSRIAFARRTAAPQDKLKTACRNISIWRAAASGINPMVGRPESHERAVRTPRVPATAYSRQADRGVPTVRMIVRRSAARSQRRWRRRTRRKRWS